MAICFTPWHSWVPSYIKKSYKIRVLRFTNDVISEYLRSVEALLGSFECRYSAKEMVNNAASFSKLQEYVLKHAYIQVLHEAINIVNQN